MPDSATRSTPSGIDAADPHRPVGVDLEGDEVALVHADQVGADRHGPLELGLVVHLDEHVEVELAGDGVEVRELVVVERRHDQEDGVGTHDPGPRHVARVDGEVLAQHGEVDGLARPRAGRRPSRRTTARR